MSHFKQSGFTIVELLIVVVVIGILAAITIVAYSGISTRAENTKTLSAMKQYSDGISMYQVTNGSYPIASVACLGSSDGICAQVTDSTGTCFGIGGAASTSGFNTTMTAMLGTLPQVSQQRMNCGGKMYAGVFYNSSDGKNANVYYFLRGNQTCPTIGIFNVVYRAQQDDTTECITSLPTLP
jgi:prepilin-type N-terminal cleavage/methylation domain-containing protein